MAGPLADIVFWIAVLATIGAHLFIIRSTLKNTLQGGAWERVWALLPAAALLVLFVFTWHAMHPGSLTLLMPSGRPAPGGISS